MFSAEWQVLAQTFLVAVFAYAALVVLLRTSGKRTLSKWNAFDFIVTVALGSTLATAILSRDVSLAEGVVGFAALIGLQFAVTWLSVRVSRFHRLVKSRAALLVYRGKFLHDAMKRERVSESEVRAALRGHGIAAVEDAGAVLLETDGSFSIIRNIGDKPATALSDVRDFESLHSGS